MDQENRININGIGLGLVISKLIVENFDGNIWFKSKWNKGSTFFFTIQLQTTEMIDHNKISLPDFRKVNSLDVRRELSRTKTLIKIKEN